MGKYFSKGQLEIDPDRGVIYFHADEGFTSLRISQLPTPVPEPGMYTRMLDISHMHGCDWGGETILEKWKHRKLINKSIPDGC